MPYLTGEKRVIILHIKAVAGMQGKTVASLSEETSLTYNTVLQLFRGSVSRIDLRTLDALCLALKVQPGELLSWAQDSDLTGAGEQNASIRTPP
jgi:DNA-binding Xre family transcriptional regulator